MRLLSVVIPADDEVARLQCRIWYILKRARTDHRC